MTVTDEIKKIEKHNKYAADFYDYEDWYVNDIMLDMAWTGKNKKVDITPIKNKLKEILSYCVLRELDKYGFDYISEKYYKEIQEACEKFDSKRQLNELYEDLRAVEPIEPELEEEIPAGKIVTRKDLYI